MTGRGYGLGDLRAAEARCRESAALAGGYDRSTAAAVREFRGQAEQARRAANVLARLYLRVRQP
jgi:hypothetical protein